MDTDICEKSRCGCLMVANLNKLDGTLLCLMTKCASYEVHVYLNGVLILSTKYCFVTAAFATDELK